jgi:hypothetical protein
LPPQCIAEKRTGLDSRARLPGVCSDAALDSTVEALPSLATDQPRLAVLLRGRCHQLLAGVSARTALRAAALADSVTVLAVLILGSERRSNQGPPAAREAPAAPAVSVPQKPVSQNRPARPRKPPAGSHTERRRRRSPRRPSHPAPAPRQNAQPQPAAPVPPQPSTSPTPQQQGRPQGSPGRRRYPPVPHPSYVTHRSNDGTSGSLPRGPRSSSRFLRRH